jgi:hypothetical protein
VSPLDLQIIYVADEAATGRPTSSGSPRSLAQWPACKTCTARPLAFPLPALIPHPLTSKDIKGVYDLALKQGS